ncbi:Fe-S oxidoreductase [Candidatus Caldarchaeum subterraneum]|uniref:Fe-S oxidoreductase n=1 Tax=Caldiarchaeum subterraneum TaxID=311458 RepID=E6N6M8_CALS0|nr:Fe-S oxidoreductase [Candidatus Caldarchaeum subterraneum]BAJ50771.1 Fe-S oxidoreductase [Candidatus Caldarchaeum subterraneum]
MAVILETTNLETKRKLVTKTRSICPECNRILEADVVEEEGKIKIYKTCPKHGEFDDLYFGDAEMYYRFARWLHDGKGTGNPNVEMPRCACPANCGLCSSHLSHTGLSNLVITNRCDLHCWYCFFYAEKAGYIYEPTLDQIREMVKQLKAERPVPGNSVQITGGEPCLRDDLPEIIRILKEEGVDHIQLNTNGIRLAHDFEFFKRVKEAGVSNLYMSFDGVTPRTNPKNHWEVPKTLENARKLGVGVVLVPTVIKSVNDHELGDIIRFGFQNIDVVRAVNFQPVSLTGRMPKKEREKYRITIPDCIHRIEEQTNGEIPSDAWFPVPACTPLTNFIEALTRRAQYELSIHFACGAGTYVFKDHDKLIPITNFVDVEGLIKYLQDKTEEIEAGKNRFYIALKVLANINKYINTNKQPTGLNLKHMLYNIIIKHDYHSVGDWHRRSLFLGMMHFQDKYNHDEERLRRCDIHYLTPDMRIIPFCAFNVIPEWYRDRIQAQYGIPIAEWEKRTGRKLKDDFYKRQLPSKQQTVPMASTKTAGFGGLKEIPVIQGGSGKEENCGPSCGCSH